MEHPFLLTGSVNIGNGSVISQIKQSTIDLLTGASVSKEEMLELSERVLKFSIDNSDIIDDPALETMGRLLGRILQRLTESGREQLCDLCYEHTSKLGIMTIIAVMGGRSRSELTEEPRYAKYVRHFFDQIEAQYDKLESGTQEGFVLNGLQLDYGFTLRTVVAVAIFYINDPKILTKYIDLYAKVAPRFIRRLVDRAVEYGVHREIPEHVFTNKRVMSSLGASVMPSIIEIMPDHCFKEMYEFFIEGTRHMTSPILAAVFKRLMHIPEARKQMENRMCDLSDVIKPGDMTRDVLEYIMSFDCGVSDLFTVQELDRLYAPERMDRYKMLKVISNPIAMMNTDELCELLYTEEGPNMEVFTLLVECAIALGKNMSPEMMRLFIRPEFLKCLFELRGATSVIKEHADLIARAADPDSDEIENLMASLFIDNFEKLARNVTYYIVEGQLQTHGVLPDDYLYRKEAFREKLKSMDFDVPMMFWRAIPEENIVQLAVENQNNPQKLGIYIAGLAVPPGRDFGILNLLPFTIEIPNLSDEEMSAILDHAAAMSILDNVSPNVTLFYGAARYYESTRTTNIRGFTERSGLLFLTITILSLTRLSGGFRVVPAIIAKIIEQALKETAPFGSSVVSAIRNWEGDVIEAKCIEHILRQVGFLMDSDDVLISYTKKSITKKLGSLLDDPKYFDTRTEFAEVMSVMIGQWTFGNNRCPETNAIISKYPNEIWNLLMTHPSLYNHDGLSGENRSGYEEALIRSFGSQEDSARAITLLALSLTKYNIPSHIFDDPAPLRMAVERFLEQGDMDKLEALCNFLSQESDCDVLAPYLSRTDIPMKTRQLMVMYTTFCDIEKARANIQWEEVMVPMINECSFNEFTNCSEVLELMERLFEEKSVLVNFWMFLVDRTPSVFSITRRPIIDALAREIQADKTSHVIEALGKIFLVPEVEGSILFFNPDGPKLDEMSEYVFNFAQNMIDTCCREMNWKVFLFTKMVANKYPFIFSRCQLDGFFESFSEHFKDHIIDGKPGKGSMLTGAYIELMEILWISPAVMDKFYHWLMDKTESLTIQQLITILEFIRQHSQADFMLPRFAHMRRCNWINRIISYIEKQLFEEQDETMRCDPWAIFKYILCFCYELSRLDEDYLIAIDELSKDENPYQLAFKDHIGLRSPQKTPGALANLRKHMSHMWSMDSNDYYRSIRDFPDYAGGGPAILAHRQIEYYQRIAQVSAEEHPRPEVTPPDGMDSEILNSLPEKMISTILHHTLDIPQRLPKLTQKMKRYLIHKPSWVWHYLKEHTTPRLLLPVQHLTMLHEIVNDLVEIGKEDDEELTKEEIRKDWIPTETLTNIFIRFLTNVPTIGQRRVTISGRILHGLWQLDKTIIKETVRFIVSTSNKVTMYILFEALAEEKQPSEELIEALCDVADVVIEAFPSYRNKVTNESVLPTIKSILERVCERVPNIVTQEICMMLLDNNDGVVEIGLDLAAKLPNEYRELVTEHVNRTVESLLLHGGELSECKMRLLHNVIHNFKGIAEAHRDICIGILDTILGKFIPGPGPTASQLMLAQSLLNIFIPVRTCGTILIDPEPFGTEQPTHTIPAVITRTAPDIWQVVEKHLNDIRECLRAVPSLLDTVFEFLQQYPEILPLAEKTRYFKMKQRTRTRAQLPIVRIHVRRSDILSDSFGMLCAISPERLLGEIRVIFQGEPGIDAGGLRREWFSLLVKELFNPNYALFIPSSNLQSFQPNPASYINPDHMLYFRFAGRIIGRAMIEEVPIDAHLSTACLKHLLGTRPSLRDLEDIDPSLYNSLHWILENDPSDLDLNFTADFDDMGKHCTVELIEDGENIKLTNENKEEYVALVVDHYLRKQIAEQLKEFCNGFHSMIPQQNIKIFQPAELDLLICGIPKIDVLDLIENCEFSEPLHAHHEIVEMFFTLIKGWSEENLAKLLIFLTGSSQVPLGGFKVFKESGRPITIAPGGEADRLPVAHTCTNTLDLPEYQSIAQMEDKLIYAISECQGFGFH